MEVGNKLTNINFFISTRFSQSFGPVAVLYSPLADFFLLASHNTKYNAETAQEINRKSLRYVLNDSLFLNRV